MFEVREAKKEDLGSLLNLYTQLKNEKLHKIDDRTLKTWDEILANPNHYVIVGCLNGAIVSSCVITIILSLVHNIRPYALIENVITDKKHRGNGYASCVMDFAREIAITHNCYKIMLMTGSRLESTLRFYKRAGYNDKDKTAFIQWL